MKKKNIEKSAREDRLTVRMSKDDSARLERLRSLFSPYVPLSQGRTISAALELAEKHFKK